MQLDTEDGETFVPPAGVVAASDAENNDAPNEHGHTQGHDHVEHEDLAASEDN